MKVLRGKPRLWRSSPGFPRPPRKSFLKARLGTKAAKNYVQLENVLDQLDEESSTMFRALSARFLYLAMDRPECAFAAKELCRQFSCPTKKGVEALKRAVRFLVGMPCLVYHFEHQPAADALKGNERRTLHQTLELHTDYGCIVQQRSGTWRHLPRRFSWPGSSILSGRLRHQPPFGGPH